MTFLPAAWLFIKSNPFKVAKVAFLGLGLLAICLITHTLYKTIGENRQLRSTLKTQNATISELKSSITEKERLSAADARRAVADEAGRTRLLVEIERTDEEEDGPIAPVLLDAYRKLLSNTRANSSD